MKLLKAMGLTPLFVLVVLLSGALAQGYSGMQPLPQQPQQAPQTMQQQGAFPSQQYSSGQVSQVEIYRGTLTSVDPSRQQIVVRTEVPGLLGPQIRDVPFRLDRDTTMTICFRSLNRCENTATGSEGWMMLTNLDKLSSFSSVQKNVTVIADPNTGHIVHVEVDYQV